MGARQDARLQLLRDRAATREALKVTCIGSSMEPVIPRGEQVHVRARRPAVGMVAAFLTGSGELELHRLIAVAPGGWWAHLGDNQTSPEPGLVHDSRIVGIADVPIVRPPVAVRLRAAVRFARAGVNVARRRLRTLIAR